MKNMPFKYITSVIVLFLFFSFFGCSDSEPTNKNFYEKEGTIYIVGTDEPFTGKIKDEAGGNIIEYEVINGKKEGTLTIYYMDGTIAMFGEMKANQNIGEWQYFYENGALESKGNFYNNLPNGMWYYYFESGNLKEKGEFLNGERIGHWVVFSETGDTIQTKNFSLQDDYE